MRGIRILFTTAVLLALAGSPARAEGLGSISGVVTDPAAIGIQGICVEMSGQYTGYWYFGETAPDGSYTITEVEPDTYIVSFYDCRQDALFLTQWFDGASRAEDATPVEVSDAAVTGIDASLQPGGFVTGTLIDTNGDPAPACVAGYDSDFGLIRVGYASEDGTYRLGPLPSGEARIHFADCGSPWQFAGKVTHVLGARANSVTPAHENGWVPEWFDDVQDFFEATPVPVVAGLGTPNIDAVLAIGASISGVVRNAQGQGLDDICVNVWNSSASGFAQTWGGYYRMDGLPAGSYTVGFFDCASGDYLEEWWDDHAQPEDADLVDLAEGASAVNIDAVLALRPRPDFGVTKLDVTAVPLTTDAATLPGTGWLRRVDVEVGNMGAVAAPGEAFLEVWVQMRSDDSRKTLGTRRFNLSPGQRRAWSFDWNGFGSVGDAEVHARLCVPDEPNRSNNHRVARSYVIAGGTGIGFTLGQQGPDHIAVCGYIDPQPSPVPTPVP